MQECFRGYESEWEGLFVPYEVAPDGYAFQVLEVRPPPVIAFIYYRHNFLVIAHCTATNKTFPVLTSWA